jgi:hypothetical protein
MHGVDASTREGDGHAVVALCGEPGMAGAAGRLAAGAAREPQPGAPVIIPGVILPIIGFATKVTIIWMDGIIVVLAGDPGAAREGRSRSQRAQALLLNPWPGPRPAIQRAGTRSRGMDWTATWRRAWSYGSFATS